MSALDDVIRYHADNCQSGNECDLSALSRAELAALRDERKKTSRALHGMIDGWRDYANGHYCRTYNPGMTQGLNCAAEALEAYVLGSDTFYATALAPQAEQEMGE